MEPVEARPIRSMSGKEMLDALDAVHDELTRLQTYRHQLLAAFDEAGHANTFGAKDTVELVSFRHRLPAAQVRAELKLAAALQKYVAVCGALPSLLDEDADTDEGDYFLHFGQAKAIVTALERIPRSAMVPVEDLDAAEQQLVKAAQHLNSADLARAGKQVRDILDTDGPEPAEEDAYRREALWYRKADQGICLGGYLANENAELFSTLIHANAKPHKTKDGQPDPRTRDKRQADALVAVLTAAATGTGTPSPNITITIDYNALKNATAHNANRTPTPNHPRPATPGRTDKTDRSSTGQAPTPAVTATPDSADALTSAGTNSLANNDLSIGHSNPQPPPDGHGNPQPLPVGLDGARRLPFDLGEGSGMGELVFGDNLSAAAVRRLACDSGVLPVVLGSNSQPLDVGMTKRFVTAPIRNALIARDKGCIICNAPPIMCDAHHLAHWIDGGPTSLANLALFCKLHHREVHHRQWSVTIIDGIPQVTRPPWADRTPPRRRLRVPPNHPPETSPGWPPPPARAKAEQHNPGETPTRSWPHTDDIPWITPADATLLNPWGDHPTQSTPPPLAS
ncbi:DUF222 domain-containing protein [Kribbella qitaiheensis]|uniref:DUF222 domain-containing protein n=1 Tax=Kribbella qitaiheensis TaxID=1544730 RepID=A0A7G6X035_9ACTN|nr:HNH endonuclease signature motif containing protein [Kribbella qitaiheensis]QNE19600.1 DUF222 domain-containing protein [Kribbella qitaiheensis]